MPTITKLSAASGAVLVAGILGAVSSPAAPPSVGRIPVYDLEAPEHALEVEVSHRSYRDPVFGDLLGLLRKDPSRLDEAETVLARYLDHVAAGRGRRALELYGPEFDAGGKDPDRLVGFVGSRLKGAERVELVQRLEYGPYRMFFIRIHAEGGTRFLALGVRRDASRFIRDDVWTDAPEIVSLFYYMARNVREGTIELHRPRELAASLEFPPSRPGPGLVLHFDGVWYDPGAPSADPTEAVGENPVTGAIARVVEAARTGTDREFLDRFEGAAHHRLSRVLADQPDRFSAFKEIYAGIGPVRHLLTMNLGEFRVHYCLQSRGTPRMEVLFFRRAGDRYLLTEGIYSNIQTLLTSKRVKRRVFETWSPDAVGQERERRAKRSRPSQRHER